MPCVSFLRCMSRLRAVCGPAVWASLAAVASQGCSSPSTSTATDLGPTGTMVVTVTNPPFSISQYVVSGPDEYALQFTGTDTIRDLPVGTYLVGFATASSIDPIVTSLFTGVVTDSVVTVAQNDTGRASIHFVTTPGTGGLWVGSTNGGSPLLAQYNTQALQGGTGPELTLPTAGGLTVFDANGDLWVGSSTANTISKYPASQLIVGGSTTPVVTIAGGALNGPYGLAFDPSGNLWVSNYSGNTIVEYAASQLESSGSPTPIIVIGGPALNHPAGISFDAYGNLWVPNAGSNTVIDFTRAQLVSGGSLAANIILTPISGSIASPHAVAFNTNGDLWVMNQANNTVVVYGPGQIVGSGALVPNGSITVPSTFSGLSAMAFDNSGDLWLTCTTSSHLIVYTGDQLASGTGPPPAQSLHTASSPVSLAFNPRPDGLPLGGLSNQRLRQHGPTALGSPRFTRRSIVHR